MHRHSPGVGGGDRVGGGGDGEGGGGDGEGGGGDGGGGGWAATNAFSCPSIAMIKIDRIPLPWSRARTLPPAASSGDLIVFAPSTSAGPEGGLYTDKGEEPIARVISATGFVTGFGWPEPCVLDSTDLFATVSAGVSEPPGKKPWAEAAGAALSVA